KSPRKKEGAGRIARRAQGQRGEGGCTRARIPRPEGQSQRVDRIKQTRQRRAQGHNGTAPQEPRLLYYLEREANHPQGRVLGQRV
ncbi:hypothetical protein BGX24_007189, partial [Mortierella sp. AD032]